MAVIILSILLMIFSSAHGYAAAEQDPRTSQWRPSEMDPSADKMIEGVELVPGTKNCGEPQCTFDLHYFYGGKEGKKNPTLKTIIFIPGGPGDIVDRGSRDLWFLEGHFNVIYFNVRGTGRSLIPKSNRYDKFLRAEYIAADVEKIRQVEMRETAEDGRENVKPWDAIYAYSYGTVVAQIYASKYKDKNAVSKLILAAPIARNIHLDNGTDHRETEDARVNLIISNLANIYAYHREDPCKKIESASLSDADKNAIKELWTAASVNEREEEFVKGTNDFCFVDPTLAQKLEKILIDLTNRYGSINFVTRYYDEIVAADPTFRPTYPPREFFVAVKRLQFTGAPSTNEFRTIMPLHNLALDADISRSQVDAGLLIGYYLASDHNLGNRCDESSQFLATLIPSGVVGIGPPSYKSLYCQRIDAAKTRFAADGDGSKRAELVLGVQDGVIRWFFNQFSESFIPTFANGDICLEGGGQGLAGVIDSPSVDEVVRRAVQRIGAQGDFSICLWNPQKYKHNVSTLILKGKADPIIAGCQAEEVFKRGLDGERTLIEFPGVGHSLILPLVQDGNHDKKTLAKTGPDNTTIVRKFLQTSTVNEFRIGLTEATPPKIGMLRELRASMWIGIKDQAVSTWTAIPTSVNECLGIE